MRGGLAAERDSVVAGLIGAEGELRLAADAVLVGELVRAPRPAPDGGAPLAQSLRRLH